VRDLIRKLDIPAVLVAGSYLGTLSHTLTAIEALGSHAISRIVISESPESPVPMQETADTLARFTDVPIVLLPRLPHWRDADPETMEAILNP
jgi:dethiobiotin synthetase